MDDRKQLRRARSGGARTSALVALALVACCAFAVMALAGCAKKVEVPDLYAMEQTEALQALSDAGLKLGETSEEASSEITFGGLILRQSPEAGESVDEGTTVDIVLSTGPSLHDPTTVPDLTGMTPEEAEKALLDAFIIPQPGKATYSNSVEPGKVCAQSTPAGSKVIPFEEPITYSTSLGKEKVKVPDVVGKPISEARQSLEKAKLSCDTTTSYSNDVAQDNVISQNVAKDTEVEKGTVVVLEVSMGKQPVAQVMVPNIATYDLESAKRTLESAGLAYSYSGDEDGTVISINPVPGTMVDQGSTVEFTLKRPAQVTPAANTQTDTVDEDSQALVERYVWQNGLGELVSWQEVRDADGNWIFEVTTRGADGNEYLSSIEADTGAVIENGYEQAHSADTDDGPTQAQVEDYVWQNGLGELVSWEQVTDENGDWYIEVVTRGSDGNEYTSAIDSDGTLLAGGIDNGPNDEGGDISENYGGADLTEADLEDIIWENGLGEMQDNPVFVPGEGGDDQWIVEVKGSDGELHHVVIDDEDGTYYID